MRTATGSVGSAWIGGMAVLLAGAPGMAVEFVEDRVSGSCKALVKQQGATGVHGRDKNWPGLWGVTESTLLIGDKRVDEAGVAEGIDADLSERVVPASRGKPASSCVTVKNFRYALRTQTRVTAMEWQHGRKPDSACAKEWDRMRAAVGDPHRRHLHRGATSQDVIDTSLTMRLTKVCDILDCRLSALIETLNELEQRDGVIALMGRTRMQRALPITARDKVSAWRRPLERCRTRLAQLCPRLLVVQFGGPVGTRGDLVGKGDALAAELARRLGLADAPCWHVNRDSIAEFASWLSLVCGSLGKIGQDVALMAQNEIGEVRLAGGGGSSAMPHKSNPVGAEVLVAFARFAAGTAGLLHQGLVAENERSGAAWTLEWLTLPPLVAATSSALAHAAKLCHGLRFPPAREKRST